MAETQLVKELEGERLIAQLKREGVAVFAAAWSKTEDGEESRLYVSSPIVDKQGPLASYKALQHALRALQPTALSISDVTMVGAGHPILANGPRSSCSSGPYSIVPFATTSAGGDRPATVVTSISSLAGN